MGVYLTLHPRSLGVDQHSNRRGDRALQIRSDISKGTCDVESRIRILVIEATIVRAIRVPGSAIRSPVDRSLRSIPRVVAINDPTVSTSKLHSGGSLQSIFPKINR